MKEYRVYTICRDGAKSDYQEGLSEDGAFRGYERRLAYVEADANSVGSGAAVSAHIEYREVSEWLPVARP